MKTICIILGLLAAFNMANAASQQKPIENKDALLYLKSYVAKDGGSTARAGTNNYQYQYTRQGDYRWTPGVGGSGSYRDRYEASDNDMWRLHDQQRQVGSPASAYPPADGVTTNVSRMAYTANGNNVYDTVSTNTGDWSVLAPPEHCDVQARVGPQWGWPSTAYGSWYGSSMDPLATGKYWRKADAKMVLETGGRAKAKQKNLFCLSATAEERTNILSAPSYWNGSEVVWSDLNTRTIAATSIKVDGKALGSDGKLWRLYADNRTIDVTPKVRGKDYFSFTVVKAKHKLIHATRHPALTETNLARTKLGVGEYVDFSFDEALVGVAWPDVLWATTGGSVGTTTSDAEMTFTAPSNAANVTVSVTVKGQTLKEKFKVVEPSGYATNTYIVNAYTNPPTEGFFQGVSGAGMYLRVFLAPTDVSFYRLQCVEVGENATSIKGYYTNYMSLPDYPANLSHIGKGANGPFRINSDNSWEYTGLNQGRDWDRCWWGNDPQLVGGGWGAGGSFTWNIPAAWRIDGSTWHTNMAWSQTFTNQANGTMTIHKFGHTVTRTTNNTYTVIQ